MADPYIQSVVQDASRIGRGPMPSPAQMTQFSTQMTGIGGLLDMAGMMPEMPEKGTTMMEMVQSGERNPSLFQNLREGEYLDAGLQALGKHISFCWCAGCSSCFRVARAKEAVGDPSQYTPKEYQDRVRYMSGQFFNEDQKNLAESAVSRIAEEGQDKSLIPLNIQSAADLEKSSYLQAPVEAFNSNKVQSLLDQGRITPEEAAAIRYEKAPRTARYETQQNNLLQDPEYKLLQDPDATGIETLPTDQGKPTMKAQDKDTERNNAALSKQMREAGLPVNSLDDAADIEPEIKEQLDIILDRDTDSTT
jgi:hypothetical protein